MCGIFGIVSNQEKTDYTLISDMAVTLFGLSESRGKEASGITIRHGDKLHIYRQPVPAHTLIQSRTYHLLWQGLSPQSLPLTVIGHSRLATNGLQVDNNNNQPVVTEYFAGVHNGIITNHQTLQKKFPGFKKGIELDTKTLFYLADRFLSHGYTAVQSWQKTFSLIEGSASVAAINLVSGTTLLCTNTGSLYVTFIADINAHVFASEKYILQEMLNREFPETRNEYTIRNLKAATGMEISATGRITDFTISGKKIVLPKKGKPAKNNINIIDHSGKENLVEPNTFLIYSKKNNLAQLKKHDFNYREIASIKRCTRCLLPVTMPLIEFDNHGVCNYCRNHKKIVYRGRKELEKLIAPFRSRDGSPDSIIAFSGGRDSSYGVHFLKQELKLNPVAFTYDWAMVTDLARQNQARIVGKLGVEHIIVSADITMKRNHIRKNILAWMKKPEVGMVPLFMAGDKQCEFYINRLASRMGIKLVFFCRGNELENEDFKWGYCGITNPTPGGVIHNLSPSGKFKLASYFARNFISNPAYINTSIIDALQGYISTYMLKHNYIYLWHYIPWEEKKLIQTLRDNYNWATSPETGTTWRTDDGTPPFYNYIYYQVQGFTENDTFRSNQIREGLLDRKTAWNLVREENRPRYLGLQWYFDNIGLDGHEVLNVVDRMPRKY